MSTRSIGHNAETLALQYLKQQGLQLVQRNFYCRGGEIDLIMRDKKTTALVFTEVRYRQSREYGGAIHSISRTKQRRIIHASLLYLKKTKRLYRQPIRYDVVCIQGDALRWIKAAFEAPTD